MSRSVLAFVLGAQLLVELSVTAGLKVDYSVDAGAVRRELHSAHCTPAIRHRNDYEGETDIVPLNLYASRTHGWSILNENHRLIDLSFVFPCPDLDPEDASSYDFVASDYQLGLARNKAKLKVFYRLGVTEEYCRGSHYHTQVPEDFAVTAAAMAGVVRHYSGAWLDGKKDKITYWEIWNGPDDTEHNWYHDGWTDEQHRAAFAEFYATALKRLKDEFGGDGYKFGGPALTRFDTNYLAVVLDACAAKGVRPDFVSWQTFTNDLEAAASEPAAARAWLDARGCSDVEVFVSGWHYVHQREGIFNTFDYDHIPAANREANGENGAAFSLGLLARYQYSPLNQAYCYLMGIGTGCENPVWRYRTGYTGAFNKTYYALKAFGQVMRDYTRLAQVENEGSVTLLGATDESKTHGCLLVADYKGEGRTIRVPYAGVRKVSNVRAVALDATHELASVAVAEANGVFTVAKADTGSGAFLITFEMDPTPPPAVRLDGGVVSRPGAGCNGSEVTVAIAEFGGGGYAPDALRGALTVNGKTYAGTVVLQGESSGCVTFAVDATGPNAVVADNAYVGVVELWLEDDLRGRADLLTQNVTLVQSGEPVETNPWFRETPSRMGEDGDWTVDGEVVRPELDAEVAHIVRDDESGLPLVYTPRTQMPERSRSVIETDFVFTSVGEENAEPPSAASQFGVRFVEDGQLGYKCQVYAALPDGAGGWTVGWQEANGADAASVRLSLGARYVLRFESDFGGAESAPRFTCSLRGEGDAAFAKMFEGYSVTAKVGGFAAEDRVSRIGFLGACELSSLEGLYAVRQAAPDERPTVDGEAVEPAAVFEAARTTKPIEYPSAPEVAGEVGAQTIVFGGVSVPVPRHYTATLSGSTVTLALNDFARPVLEDSNDDKKAISVGETTVTLHVGNRIEGLFYRVVTTTALNGDWKPVTEFLPVADFTVDRVKTDSAAFYKIEVSDVKRSMEN